MKIGFKKIISPVEKFLSSITALYKKLRSRNPAGRYAFRDDFIQTKAYNKGFTLIELLVVILIIGILAAVALPQYQVAVMKSRAAELLLNLRAARQASEAYYLANGNRPLDWTILDISIPYKTIGPSDCGDERCANGLIVTPHGSAYYLDIDGYIGASYPRGGFDLVYWYSNQQMYCRVQNDSSKQAHQVCRSLGGTWTYTQDNGWQVYALKT